MPSANQGSSARLEGDEQRILRNLSGRIADELDGPTIVPLDYPRAPLRLVVSSPREVELRTRSCAKEPHTIAWIERELRPGDVFYDIGANIGAYSLVAAARLQERGTVVAFEPSYSSFSRLCDNIVLNGLADVVVPIPLPLAAATGVGTFSYKRLFPGSESHAVESDLPQHVPTAREPAYRQRALTVRLDDLIATFGLPRPNHVKLDVDGAELVVLSGAEEMLDSPELKTLMIEIHEDLEKDVVVLLEQHGFVLAERHPASRCWYGLFHR